MIRALTILCLHTSGAPGTVASKRPTIAGAVNAMNERERARARLANDRARLALGARAI